MALWVAVLAAYRGGFIKQALGIEGLAGRALASAARRAVAAKVAAARRAGRMGPDEQQESTSGRCSPVGRRPRAAWSSPARRTASSPGTTRSTRARSGSCATPRRRSSSKGRIGDGLRDLEELPVVAIVGARNPSPYGREMARLIARDLTDAGVLVVSGLAMGIDAIAQRRPSSLVRRAGRAQTSSRDGAAAPSPCSAAASDVTYPRENARLSPAIARHGPAVSEFAWGRAGAPLAVPGRNRVIAGLARAVVVVEGSERSGSLLTATFASDLGRDVLAVPGEAGRRLSAGPHRLLRRGAHLCESADDVLDAIGLGRAAWSTQVRRPAPAVTGASRRGRRASSTGASGRWTSWPPRCTAAPPRSRPCSPASRSTASSRGSTAAATASAVADRGRARDAARALSRAGEAASTLKARAPEGVPV